MIRAATEQDIPKIVEMGLRFIAESDYKGKITGDKAQMGRFAAHLIANGKIFIAETEQIVGMLGMLIYPHPFSGETTAVEVFWWVEPEYRGREGLLLMKEAEKFAKDSGAVLMQMVAPNERVAGLYRRKGYERVEETYQRKLV